jgi:alpha-beta hydrolase superfamily lysophospholipase
MTSPAGTSRVTRILKTAARRLAVGVIAVAVTLLALAYFFAGNGPPMQPWHTEILTEEFTAGDADVRTFDDYRALEDRLFAELDETIVAETGTGPAFALVRYSRGSLADPARRDHDWNRSFELPVERPAGAVLLLHGMSDSPYSLRALGADLQRHGYHVLGLRLPGHGTAPSGLTTVTWEDMAAATAIGVAHLSAATGGAPLHIVGYSNGAALALDYTLNALDGQASPVPASLVLISPSIAVSPTAGLARIKDWLAGIPGLEPLAWTQILPEFDPFRYNSFSSNAAFQVHRLTRSVKRRIESRAPSGRIADFPSTLVFLSSVDATVSTSAVVDNLLEHLAPNRHELVLFDVNRQDVRSTVMIADPGPLTARLMNDGALPFALTLIANENPGSRLAIARHKPPFSNAPTTDFLGVSWPPSVISLSHIALPFPPDDPLYGRERPSGSELVFLGEFAIEGERGLLLFPADWLIRLRHNPFYAYLEGRTLKWLDDNDLPPASTP